MPLSSNELPCAEDGADALRRRLETAHAALREFAGFVAHDVQGPLRRIARLSDLLDADADDAEAARELAARIGGVARRLDALVGAMLDFAAAGQGGDTGEAVDLGAVLDAIEAEIAGDGAAPKIVRRFPEGAAPRIAGDRRLIAQVFENLIGNALKHGGRAAPRIEVAASAAGATWRISVTDDGRGFGEGVDLERLFAPFGRGATSAAGVGLGLTLCRRIVESLGGGVQADAGYRDGARFVLTLPRAETLQSESAEAASRPDPRAA